MICIICDTIHRLWSGSTPEGRVLMLLELPVTLFIAIEFIAFVVHGWRGRRRNRRLKKYIRPCYMRALPLQDEFRGRYRHEPAGLNATAVVDWMKRVDQWVDATSQTLEKYSPDAATAFLRDSGGFVKTHGNSTHPFSTHAKLEMYLNNLHGIIERADFYF
jgi:hypothetical protein